MLFFYPELNLKLYFEKGEVKMSVLILFSMTGVIFAAFAMYYAFTAIKAARSANKRADLAREMLDEVSKYKSGESNGKREY